MRHLDPHLAARRQPLDVIAQQAAFGRTEQGQFQLMILPSVTMPHDKGICGPFGQAHFGWPHQCQSADAISRVRGLRHVQAKAKPRAAGKAPRAGLHGQKASTPDESRNEARLRLASATRGRFPPKS